MASTTDLAPATVPRRRRRRRGAVTVSVLLVALLGYGTADALDEVPGSLTLTPAPADPLPHPTLRAEPVAAPGVAELDPAAPVPQGVAALVDAFAADPRLTSAVPGRPRPGTPAADVPPPPDAAPVDPSQGLAAQHSVPPGTPPAVIVLDTASGQVLGASGEATPRVPASAQKLLTAAAVLTTRDPAATLDTRVLLGDDATLTLVGGGDVLLGADAGNPEAVDGRAGIGDLARAAAAELAARGVTGVHLRLDDSLLPPPNPAPGLTPADIRWVMPTQPLAVHTGLTNGARSTDPALQAAALFAAHLQGAGIAVTGGPDRGSAPEGAQEVARVSSAPLAEVVRFAIKESDNSVTEILGRLVALDRGMSPDLTGATAAVTAVVGELGVDTTGVALADLSGLSPHNRVTVTALAQTLRLPLAPGHRGLVALAADLPVAGLDGTLHDRLDGPAAGVARGKTGTLGAVTSLAGHVLDADGRVLTYAVIADGLPLGGVLGARAAIDDLVVALAGCGC